uniref:PINc domain-containing protein n=1 Tax=Macrostomum lignano TaxID=282301 RepID=A0A1I8FH23_9PLAT
PACSTLTKRTSNKRRTWTQLSFIEINTAFTASYLHCHGKLFTRIGMESFQEACSQTLLELAAWLPATSPRLSGYFNWRPACVFSASWAARQGPPGAAQYRSVAVGESAVRLALDFAAEHVKNGGCLPLPEPTRALLSSLKLLLDWMEVSPEAWNPPPLQRDPHLQPQLDVWEDLASLFTDCARFSNRPEVRRQLLDFEESKKPPISPPGRLPAARDPSGGRLRQRLHPHAQPDPDFLRRQAGAGGAVGVTDAPEAWSVRERLLEDSIRLDACAVFADLSVRPGAAPARLQHGGRRCLLQPAARQAGLRAMEDCQQPQPQPPSLEFAGPASRMSRMNPVPLRPDDELAASAAADGIRELRLRKQELRRALDEQQERQRAYKSSGQRYMELEIVPINLLPDTNCYIHYLGEIRSLLAMGKHNLILPIVHGDSSEHAGYVASQARAAVAMLEEAFESKAGGAARRPGQSGHGQGSTLDTIAFRGREVIGRPAKNDDLILTRLGAFMPKDKDQPVRLHRDIVLLTSDRNLRLKAIGRTFRAKTVPAFSQSGPPAACAGIDLQLSLSRERRLVALGLASRRVPPPLHVQVRLLVQLSRAPEVQALQPGTAGSRRPAAMRSRDCASCACSCRSAQLPRPPPTHPRRFPGWLCSPTTAAATPAATTASAVDEDGLVPLQQPTARRRRRRAPPPPPLAPSPMQSSSAAAGGTPSAEASAASPPSPACFRRRDSAADGLHQRLLDGDRLVTTQRDAVSFRGGGGSSRRRSSFDPVPQPQIPPVGLAAEQLRKFRQPERRGSRLRCLRRSGATPRGRVTQTAPPAAVGVHLPQQPAPGRKPAGCGGTGEQRSSRPGSPGTDTRRQARRCAPTRRGSRQSRELQANGSAVSANTQREKSEMRKSSSLERAESCSGPWVGLKLVSERAPNSPAFWLPAGPMLSRDRSRQPSATPAACTGAETPSCTAQQQRLSVDRRRQAQQSRLLGDLVAGRLRRAGVWLPG